MWLVRGCPSLVGGRPAKSVTERSRGFKSHTPRHTLCLEESHGSGLFLIKELSDWVQGFIKLAMRRIPFLTPRITSLDGVKRKFNNLSKCTKSNDKFKAP